MFKMENCHLNTGQVQLSPHMKSLWPDGIYKIFLNGNTSPLYLNHRKKKKKFALDTLKFMLLNTIFPLV